ncbi:class D sortase [Papillibacter cinnamivorans]|uniref:LPXTG-site transpeptidase (Sortase) family protein n=1 Tax=Papillibacter cinnamivorans DSM 12816 TaxID=1122930 RepID=A0A1W2A3C2_9FIRM|nr:class D sortase [Papillibacter cinnamivorans]SMC55165.1 LPXTG-site transpeptidase (sortase) family protein [Papillibacter cinnamivorans DSM 12816]
MKKPKKFRFTIARILVIAGLVVFLSAMAYEAYQYPWSTIFGGSQAEDAVPDPTPIVLDKEDAGADIVDEPEASVSPTPEATANLPGDETEAVDPLSQYVQLGILKIPKLKVSQYILEGTKRQMRYGVGHVTGTAAVGQAGNCAIAGHRPYPFRYLDKLVSGDSIILKADDHVYTYTVYDSFAVLPNETWVLNTVDGEPYALTLITCTPYMVSSHRLIVRARLTDVDGMTPGAFYGTPAEPSSPAAEETTLPEATEPALSVEEETISPSAPQVSEEPSSAAGLPVPEEISPSPDSAYSGEETAGEGAFSEPSAAPETGSTDGGEPPAA